MAKKKATKPRGIPLSQIFRSVDFRRNYEMLMRENPPDNPALLHAITNELYRCAAIGAEFNYDQTIKGKKPKRLIGEYRETAQSMREIVKAITAKPENRDLAPDELWPLLFDALDELGAEPEALKKLQSYRYTPLSGDEKTISFGRFRNLISEIRNE